MSLTKDEAIPAAVAGSRTDIEGFALMSPDNAGKTASAVVAQLHVALQSKGKASTTQSAALYATLLLSSRAPEFLVKDIPAVVVVGSHAWVSFVTAVERIEANAPGATATMSYAQVMLHAGIAPVTAQEHRVEYLAQNAALKHWAVINGMGLPATDDAMHVVRTAFDAQIKELRDASSVSLTSPPTVRNLALEALKKALPAMDPTQFENKCITLQPAYRTFPGPYSVLDLYVDRRALSAEFPGPAHAVEQFGQTHLMAGLPSQAIYEHTQHVTSKKSIWVSSSTAVNVNEVLKTLKTLPDIAQPFDSAFSTFATDVEKVTKIQIKHLIQHYRWRTARIWNTAKSPLPRRWTWLRPTPSSPGVRTPLKAVCWSRRSATVRSTPTR